MHRSNRCDLGRDFSACVDTRKKIVAIQIALFSACVDTRKNSRDLNRDSNRAFLVCGNAPKILSHKLYNHFSHTIGHIHGDWGTLMDTHFHLYIQTHTHTQPFLLSLLMKMRKTSCGICSHPT